MSSEDQKRKLPTFISTSEDLVTEYAKIRDGFMRQALTKTQKATLYVKETREFYDAMQQHETAAEILADPVLRPKLIAASGFSDKATQHLSDEELNDAVAQVFQTIVAEAGGAFRQEIVYRYMLTKGDSLGGEMRNVIGAEGGKTLTAAILDSLSARQFRTYYTKEGKLKNISWGNRLLLFDVKPKFIDKNVDIILLDISDRQPLAMNLLGDTESPWTERAFRPLLEVPDIYVACGELKGGIDPAGADEHWKTGDSALGRILKQFASRRSIDGTPKMLFVGAAIAKSMAEEIFSALQNGDLDYAANLTKPQQLSDLATWLISL